MTNDKGILIKNIYYMLSYAFQVLKQQDYEDVAAEEFDEVYKLFAAILCKGVPRLLKQGLHKEYITHHDNMTSMRGKLDINGTIINKMQQKQLQHQRVPQAQQVQQHSSRCSGDIVQNGAEAAS